MASTMEFAPLHLKDATEKVTTSKHTVSSLRPQQATVEDYFSEESQSALKESRIRMNSRASPKLYPRSIIGNSSSPKQANVSWSDAPIYFKSQPRKNLDPYADLTSRFSEALTAVPSSINEHDRNPIERQTLRRSVPNSITRDPGNRLASSRRKETHERGGKWSNSSDSGGDDERDSRSRAPLVTNGRRTSIRNYTGYPVWYGRPVDQSDERERYTRDTSYPGYDIVYPHPSTPYSYNYGLAQMQHNPWSHLYQNPFEHYRNSQMSGATAIEDSASYGSYHHGNLPPCHYGAYPSFNLPLPPASDARRSEGIRRAEEEVPSYAKKNESAERKETLAVSEAEKAEKNKDFMYDRQQILDKYDAIKERAQAKDVASTNPASHLELPPYTDDEQRQERMSDLDQIKIMEERVYALKLKNEEKLIEANQVLTYLSRGYEADQQKVDDGTVSESDGKMNGHAEVPNVHMFRTPEDETDYNDDSEDSDTTDQNSVTGNSSGSSVSSAEQRSRRMHPTRRSVEAEQDQYTASELTESTEDGSTDSDTSDHESTASRSETTLGTPRIPEIELNSGSRAAVVRQPVPEYQVENDVMEEVIALRRDLSILKRQMTRRKTSWFGVSLSSAIVRCKKYFRTRPQPGTQRLEWMCECGSDMYADLSIENGAQYRQMLEFLTRPGPKTQRGNQTQMTPSQLEGGTAPLDYTSLQSTQSSLGQRASPASTIGSGSTYVGTDGSQFPAAQQSGPYARNKYLELCVNVGKYETKLAEIQISSSQSNGAAICTNAHLFRQIYHRYFALRKHTWRRFLYRPAGIKFVHFGVQAGYRVSFFSSDPLPSEDEIAAKRYEYCLKPPVPPPMDSRTFLHYFYKHDAHSNSTDAKWVDRLPKKLGDSLTRSLVGEDLLEGWGIHIIEGPNKIAICWALMIVLLLSFGVSLGYDIVTGSGDSGFAIGQWMVAALTVALSALYFSLEDEVNSNYA